MGLKDGATYFIINPYSKTALDLSEGSKQVNTKITGWDWHFQPGVPSDNQAWTLKIAEEVNSRTYYNLINKQSGTYLDINGNSKSNGTPLVGSPGNGGAHSQQWSFADQGGHAFLCYKMHNRMSYDAQQDRWAVDLARGSADSGTPITLYQSEERNGNQMWLFIPKNA